MYKWEYRSVSIPKELYISLQKFVEASNGQFVSVSEVVRDSLREYLKANM